MKRDDCATTGDAIMSSNAKTKTKTKTKAKTKVVNFDAVNSAKFEKGGNGNDEEASMTPAATDGARYFSGTKDAKGGDLTRREEVLLTAKQDRFNVEKSGTANKIKLEREKKDALKRRISIPPTDQGRWNHLGTVKGRGMDICVL